MKNWLLVILILITLSDSFGQQTSKEVYKPFSILIIHPDSIQLHESLKPWVDTVEVGFRDSYYSHLKEMELLMQLKSENEQQNERLRLQRARWIEMDVQNTKYHHLVSMLTGSELWSFFDVDHNKGFSFEFIFREELFSYELEKISSYHEVDYVLLYKKITTPIQNDELVLKIEAELYSRKEKRVMYESTTYGYARFYTDNSGVLQACYNDLQCLLESGAMASSGDLLKFFKRKQKN